MGFFQGAPKLERPIGIGLSQAQDYRTSINPSLANKLISLSSLNSFFSVHSLSNFVYEYNFVYEFNTEAIRPLRPSNFFTESRTLSQFARIQTEPLSSTHRFHTKTTLFEHPKSLSLTPNTP